MRPTTELRLAAAGFDFWVAVRLYEFEDRWLAVAELAVPSFGDGQLPDFFWWVDSTCWAIDTTGIHILTGKVRGKLLSIAYPKVALVVRGRVGASFDSSEEREGGWSLILPGATGPRRLFHNDLGSLLDHLRSESAIATN